MITARLRPRTIESRIAALTFVLLGVVLGVVAVAVDHEADEGARHSLDRTLASEAETIAARTRYHGERVELESEGVGEDVGEPTNVRGKKVPAWSRASFFQVWSPAGLVQRSPADAQQLPAPDPALLAPLESVRERRVQRTTIETPQGYLRLYTLAISRAHYTSEEQEDERPDEGIRVTVVVQVARSLAEAAHTVEEVRGALAISIPFALVLGTLGAFLVARRSTAPMARLGREVSEVGTGSLEKRLDLATVEGELLELARALNGAFDRLAGAVARERRFSSDVAHELRTPLSITRSSLELALSRERSADDYKEAITRSLEANGRLEAIVTSLLLLGRAESVEIVRKPHDLRGIVAAAVDSLTPTARRAGLEVKVRVPETPCTVLGHSTLLERLVANLLDNALRHGASPWGVEVSLETAAGKALVSVRDRGPGFPEGFAERAFERFARADDSRARSSGGAGLGLSIAKAIARAHGGEIVARSREGGGAEMLVTLPLVGPTPGA